MEMQFLLKLLMKEGCQVGALLINCNAKQMVHILNVPFVCKMSLHFPKELSLGSYSLRRILSPDPCTPLPMVRQVAKSSSSTLACMCKCTFDLALFFQKNQKFHSPNLFVRNPLIQRSLLSDWLGELWTATERMETVLLILF